jgi:hypothetical protein
MHIIARINTEFLGCFMGGLPALATLTGFPCPQIIPHRLAFVEPGTFCTPCTGHSCPFALKNWTHHFIAYLSHMQTELEFCCVDLFGFHFMFALVVDLLAHMPCSTFHASQHHSSEYRHSSHTT